MSLKSEKYIVVSAFSFDLTSNFDEILRWLPFEYSKIVDDYCVSLNSFDGLELINVF